jgi:hypothetical protein
MWKKMLFLLLMIPLLIGLSAMASAQIVVEDATVIWQKDMGGGDFPDIPSRITLEYVTTISEVPVAAPPEFDPRPRIIVEYATGITQFGSVRFPACACDLNNDHTCNMFDWIIFAPDWGRTDCNEPGAETCECDLNGDGTCNMFDWIVFAPDWGRTDCPVFP